MNEKCHNFGAGELVKEQVALRYLLFEFGHKRFIRMEMKLGDTIKKSSSPKFISSHTQKYLPK